MDIAKPAKTILAARTAQQIAPFDKIECDVIGLASHDHSWSLHPQSFTSRLHHLFNIDVFESELANPKLEILRKLSIALHLDARDDIPALAEAALSAGYSPGQIASLEAHFARDTRAGRESA